MPTILQVSRTSRDRVFVTIRDNGLWDNDRITSFGATWRNGRAVGLSGQIRQGVLRGVARLEGTAPNGAISAQVGYNRDGNAGTINVSHEEFRSGRSELLERILRMQIAPTYPAGSTSVPAEFYAEGTLDINETLTQTYIVKESDSSVVNPDWTYYEAEYWCAAYTLSGLANDYFTVYAQSNLGNMAPDRFRRV